MMSGALSISLRSGNSKDLCVLLRSSVSFSPLTRSILILVYHDMIPDGGGEIELCGVVVNGLLVSS